MFTHPSSRLPAALPALLLLFVGPVSALAQQDTAAAKSDTAATGAATLQGRVVSGMSGAPLSDATVEIEDLRKGAITDAEGRFTISGLPAGELLVSVRHVGFEEKTVPLELEAGTVTDATLLLSETVLRVEAIDVTVEQTAPVAKLEEFERRRSMGLGHFIGPEEVEDQQPDRSSDLLRGVPGLRVSPSSYGNSTVEMVRRSPPCEPTVFIDGLEVPGGQIDDINPMDVLAVEIYRGSSEIPVVYARTAGRCGAILVWTRTGERP